MGSPLGAPGGIMMSRRIGTNPGRLMQYGLPVEEMKANRIVLLFANVRDPRKTQIRYNRNCGREMAKK
jgi:hypothetical protein